MAGLAFHKAGLLLGWTRKADNVVTPKPEVWNARELRHAQTGCDCCCYETPQPSRQAWGFKPSRNQLRCVAQGPLSVSMKEAAVEQVCLP